MGTVKFFTFALFCTLFSSILAFSLHDAIREHNRNTSALDVAESQACKCKNGRCVTDNRGKTKCNCKPGYAHQDEFTCESCDCGSKGKCIFMPHPKSTGGLLYQKKCICDLGSAEKDGVCIDCHCGENSKCEFEGDEKICYCIENFSEKDGVCTRCDCGFNGECAFNNGQKTCTCDEGYLEYGGYCKECDCGEYGKCYLNSGDKVCDCKEGFKDNSGTCQECYCGPSGLACGFAEGEKICHCAHKTAQYKDRCVDCNCGENSGGCEFVKETKVCSCHDGYVQKGDVCKVRCSMYRQCHNGGHCSDGICKCLPGTSGEFCEVIETCDRLCPNRGDVNCTYDPRRQKPYCKCLDERLGFHQDIRDCRRTCDDNSFACQNGGRCVQQEYSRFCDCLEGTGGDYCEIVPECFGTDCGSEAICRYDVQRKSATCFCHNGELTFDRTDRKCKRTCGGPSDCKNGGTCTGQGSSKFCRCLSGTKGDFCEEVSGCINKDCGSDARCVYDVDRGIAVCKCTKENYGYDPVEFRCRFICRDSSMCHNGGRCEGSGPFSVEMFCRCLEGTEGDLCEKKPVCDLMDCGYEAQCMYDEARRTARCMCTFKELSFNPIDKKCKRACVDEGGCKNGGKCLATEFDSFCECPRGTSGDACEIVDECVRVLDMCKDESRCVYDVDKGKAICVCPKEGEKYDPLTQSCKGTCVDEGGCKNGGKCVNRDFDSFCECPDGTSGDACEIINECVKDVNKCRDESRCEYDANKGKAICVCPKEGEKYDPYSGRCKLDCSDEQPCKNGGKCSFHGDDRFCDCLVGTSGDACEVVDECVQERDRCKGDDSVCTFDVGRVKAVCECLHSIKRYDPVDRQCKLTCDSDVMCQNGGLCMNRGDYLFCECKKGTSGTFCENVDICEEACGNGDDVECKYLPEGGYVECSCKDAKSVFDPSTKSCERCDCGGREISCHFREGNKICVCPADYTVKDGQCKKYRCTERKCLHGRCDIIGEKEVCSCFEGFALEGDECRKLNCSRTACMNGTCIVRHEGKEECICPSGYTLRGGLCIRGQCRIDTCYGGQCKIVDGELMCVCPERFGLEGIGCYETVCKIQMCFGGKCVVRNDTEICTCPDNHILVNDVCKRILCEKKNCFGGKCDMVKGEEVCTCPTGFSLFEDVCRENIRPHKKGKGLFGVSRLHW